MVIHPAYRQGRGWNLAGHRDGLHSKNSTAENVMKASVLTAPATLEIRDLEVPEPGPGEVRLKIAVVGVCGSDVHYYRHGAIGDQKVKYPTLLGHEPSAVIDAVGEGVELDVGARVAVEPALPCGKCEHCIAGRGNICPNVVFLGTPPVDGIFSQYRVMPSHCCIPIPDGMSLVEAALLEPLGVGLHAVELTSVRPGDTVCILGGGPIGLVTLLAAKCAGAKEIYLTDKVGERLDCAEKLGATAVLNRDEAEASDWILDHTGGRGVDVSFEAVGVQETVSDAIKVARIGGRSCMIGIPTVPELTLPFHDARRKELAIYNCRRSNREADRCLDLVSSGRLDLKTLATHHFPLEKTQEAFDLVEAYGDGVIRAMIHPNGELEET